MIINVRKLTSVSDYIVVCSADSEKQVQAIAYNIDDGLRKQGERPLGSEGLTSGRWALVDYGDVVVHVFLENIRKFYDIEGLWSDAPAVSVKDKPAPKKAPVKKAAPAVKTASVRKTAAKPAAGKASASKAAAGKKTAVKKTAAAKKAGPKRAAKPAAVKPGIKKTKGE